MQEMLLRFAIGGLAVSLFAAFGDIFRPKSFAGLFGAAPSIALATLGLTIARQGKAYAGLEARSMVLGAAAFFVYACLVSRRLMRHREHALGVSVALLPVWLAASFGLWAVLLRGR
ncbi:MAG: DUF3147 family protein [Acidobacteriota bacterium]|nr:DUF3147 family protein [Acidobacteriota bacterium]